MFPPFFDGNCKRISDSVEGRPQFFNARPEALRYPEEEAVRPWDGRSSR